MAPPKSVAIEVVIQAKPYKLFVAENDKLKGADDKEVVSVIGEPPTLRVMQPEFGHSFEYDMFDGVFNGSRESFEEIYDAHVKGKVQSMFEGVSSTVFAYGQSNSGKTHTVSQILSMAVKSLLALATSEGRYVSFTCVELYMDKINDLLDDAKKTIKVKTIVPNDPTSLTYLDGAEGKPLASFAEFQKAMRDIERRRKKAVTNMNARSSRSHLIVSFLLHNGVFEPRKVKGKLNIIDLAGNESISEAGTVSTPSYRNSFAKGTTKETGSINLSLLKLKEVIEALNQKRAFVPYKDEKLTEFLKDSLGGAALALIIGCIAPNSGNLTQTFRTLEFCQQAKSVRNMVKTIDTSQLSAEELHKLLTASQLKVNQLQSNNPLTQKNKNLQKELDKLRVEVQHQADVIADMEQQVNERDAELEEKAEEVTKLQSSINEKDKRARETRKNVEVRVNQLKKKVAGAEKMRSRIDELEKEERELKTQVVTRDSKLKDEATRADEMLTRIAKLEDESRALQSEVASRDSDLEKEVAKSNEMRTLITRLEEEATELRMNVESKDSELEKEVIQADNMRTRISELEEEARELRIKVVARDSKLGKEGTEAEEMRILIAELQEEERELRVQVSERDSKLEEGATQADEMRIRIAELEEEAQDLRVQVVERDSKLEEEDPQIDEMRSRIALLEEEIRELRMQSTDRDSKSDEESSQIHEMRARIAELQTESDDLRKYAQARDSNLEEKGRELGELRSTITVLKREASGLRIDVEMRDARAEERVRENDELRARIRKLENEARELRKQSRFGGVHPADGNIVEHTRVGDNKRIHRKTEELGEDRGGQRAQGNFAGDLNDNLFYTEPVRKQRKQMY